MVQYKGKKSRKYVINFNKSKINNANQIEMIGPAPAIEIFLRMTAPHQCSRVSIFVIIFNGVPPGLKYHHAKRYRKLRWPTSQPAELIRVWHVAFIIYRNDSTLKILIMI